MIQVLPVMIYTYMYANVKAKGFLTYMLNKHVFQIYVAQKKKLSVFK